jgi:hypothetical protein
MKNLICAAVLLVASLSHAGTVKLWDGKTRGMDLVAVGHKRVTVFLADGRTTLLGIPILVEKPKAAVPVTGNQPATLKR